MENVNYNNKKYYMEKKELVKLSKTISYLLRHHPEAINIKLDDSGWAKVHEFIENFNNHYKRIKLNFEKLKQVVEKNDKKRFSFNENKTKIRANYGHSINIKLGYKPAKPPEYLYHGTVKRNLKSIKEQGLIKKDRNYVHLSFDYDSAYKVGVRYGRPIVLKINTKKMYSVGYKFFLSESGIWLTEHIPPQYIVFQ